MNIKDQRDYAWSYFQLHAGQRMTTFNFFIVIAALLSTALATTLAKDFEYHTAGVILGAGIATMAYIFWKLDQRVRFLVKHAEESLKLIECDLTGRGSDDVGKYAALFSDEEGITSDRKAGRSCNLWQWHLSYSECFGGVYILFFVLGILGGIHAIFRVLA